MSDRFYIQLPLRVIVQRWTETLEDAQTAEVYAQQKVELDCGHVMNWHGQKKRVRCWLCGVQYPKLMEQEPGD